MNVFGIRFHSLSPTLGGGTGAVRAAPEGASAANTSRAVGLTVAKSPALDEGGPSRVLALLLARAPGWPTGPGNPDDAVLEAQRALDVAKHPLNELALGECLAATGDTAAAKAAYERAAALASTRGDAEGAEWAAQAQKAFEAL